MTGTSHEQGRSVPRWSAAIFALAVVAAVAGWIASGGGLAERVRRPLPYAQSVDPSQTTPEIIVRVAESKAVTHEAAISVTGLSRASRVVAVRSEVGGRVIGLPVEKGDEVATGIPIARLAMGDREARHREALATVHRWELETEAARKLAQRGYNAPSTLANAEASLESARAALAIIDKEISDTTIVAPFDGVLHQRDTEIGDLIAAGDTVAVVADLDPLVVEAQIGEHDRAALAVAGTARVRFLDGVEREGRVRYLSTIADPRTRTFTVEVAIDNPDLQLVDGLTAQLTIPTASVAAHAVPASVLTLDADGQLGLKVLGEGDRVAFMPVHIVEHRPRSVLVTGLPDGCRVVVAGQDYVRTGDVVRSENMGPMRTQFAAGG